MHFYRIIIISNYESLHVSSVYTCIHVNHIFVQVYVKDIIYTKDMYIINTGIYYLMFKLSLYIVSIAITVQSTVIALKKPQKHVLRLLLIRKYTLLQRGNFVAGPGSKCPTRI